LLDGDKAKAEEIWDTSRYVISYSQFKSVLSLGLSIDQSSLPFEKVMMFSWIKEALENDRKTRV
jgi:hypothetical protein